MAAKLLFDLKSAAQALSLTQDDIKILIKTGELRPANVRGRILLHREELMRFAEPVARPQS